MNATKHELLVFSRKEAAVILVLLVLVAMFSFTIGLKTGKDLAATQHSATESHQSSDHSGEHSDGLNSAPLSPEHAEQSEHAEPGAQPAAHSEAAEPIAHAKPVAHVATPSGKDLLDQTTERVAAGETAVVAEQKVVTALPQKKKAHVAAAVYTLQLGAYRTIAEATEQVAVLKRQGHDSAFYFEAQVPGKGLWYRVGLGRYDSKTKAEEASKALTEAHKDIPAHIVQQVGQ